MSLRTRFAVLGMVAMVGAIPAQDSRLTAQDAKKKGLELPQMTDQVIDETIAAMKDANAVGGSARIVYPILRGGQLNAEQEKRLVDHLENLKQDASEADLAGIDTRIFQVQNLTIGKIAPDIVGEDLDEVPFKLSDYRGKVVVIDFWGDW